MVIFRRHSNSLTDSGPILEALTSSSRYLLADFDNKDNVVVSADLQQDNNDEDGEASSSKSAASNDHDTATADADAAGSSDDLAVSSDTTSSLADSVVDEEEALAQAFLRDFEVKLDGEDDKNVKVSMDVPAGIPIEDLTVQVDDDCILRVSGEVTRTDDHSATGMDDSSTSLARVEQAFQLDEQSLDIDKVQAVLSSDGVLTITAPKKDDEDCTLQESLPIFAHRPTPCSADYLKVIVDLPGVHLEDIHVSYANGKLRVSASRHFGRVRSFKRTIRVDTQTFEADLMKVYLSKGRLIVQVPPKTGDSSSREIEIQTSTSSSSSDKE